MLQLRLVWAAVIVGLTFSEEIFSLSQLTPSQFNLALCKLMGFSNWQVDAAAITCELNLELMEKFDDFKFVTGRMLEQALAQSDLSNVEYNYPTTFAHSNQSVLASILNRLDPIVLSPEVALACDNLPLNQNRLSVKAALLWPEVCEVYRQKFQERIKQEQAAAKEAAEKEVAEKEAAEKEAAAKAAADAASADAAPADAASAEAAPAEPTAAPQEQNEVQPALEAAAQEASEAETPEEAPEQDAVTEESAATDEIPCDVVVEDPILEEIQAQLVAQHRYQGRKVKLHFIMGWDGNDASMLWSLNTIHYQSGIVDSGLTDVLRDVFVYEWFDKQSADFKAALGAQSCDLDALYQSLELSDIVFLPDGKSVLWYRLTKPLLGPTVEGFGVDIDPPFKHNYAIGVKHVFMGKLEDYPTINLYRTMLSHEGLKSVVTGCHFTPPDNISPFSLEETTQQMTFINDAYLIFDLPLKLTPGSKHKIKNIEVLVRYNEAEFDLDAITARLKQLQEQDLADIEQLNADIVSTIAEPIIAMKNQQEEKRRAKDPEYATYTFKDPIHRNEFTLKQFMQQYALTMDRIIINDHEFKFLFPTSLFAFSDKDDDKFQEDNKTLGLVHADAIVVTLVQQDSGLDFSSIDLVDCVQIPFGMHQNQDIATYNGHSLRDLLVDLNTPLDPQWQEWLNQIRSKVMELRAKASAPSIYDEVRARAREKTIKTRERRRQERKKKNKKK